jgi:isopentenyl diphosphate isomerase/L-lactate dehydrogenase-like FMN-dependent dehydrogenase
VTLLGDTFYAPILVAPIANQTRFHPEGERATVKGASAARAAAIVSSSTSVPIGALVTESATPIWYQVHAGDPAAPRQVATAVEAGCKAILRRNRRLAVRAGKASGAGTDRLESHRRAHQRQPATDRDQRRHDGGRGRDGASSQRARAHRFQSWPGRFRQRTVAVDAAGNRQRCGWQGAGAR